MPNALLTEIVVLLDRSHSMSVIRNAMIGGFTDFLREQRAHPDPAVISLYQFDDKFDKVYEERVLADAPPLDLVPRGNTALLDALGKSMVLVGERLAAKPEFQRPGKVVFLIITDGQENASTEWSRKAVADKIRHQRETYNWQFAFLGANLDSIAEAASLNIDAQGAANFAPNPVGVRGMYTSASRGVSGYRSARGAEASLSIAQPNSTPDEEK